MLKPLLLAAPILFASIASAQISPCQAYPNTPALIRAEGVAERIADIVVTCPGSAGPAINVTIDLSTVSPSFPNSDPNFVPTAAVVTNRLLAPASSGLEALLLIDELSSPPVAGTNVFQGVLTGASQVTFLNVPSNGKTYRIANIRVDARDLPDPRIAATVHIGQGLAGSVLAGIKAAGTQFSLQNPAGNPAGLDFTLSSLNAPLAASTIATGGVLTHQLVFTEGFDQSFRRRNTATSLANASALADQGTPGTDYHTESGFYLSALPATNGLNGAGLATQGTRLVARFANIPAGVSLYVTTGALPNTGASSALLTAADSSGAGAYSAVAPTTTITVGGASIGIAPVMLAGGSGTAAWEVLDADTAMKSYTFGLVVAYAAPQTGTAVVTGGLGPLSTVPVADAVSPVPRFADLSADAAACAASPCLTAAPSAITITSQIGSAAPVPINIQVASTGSSLLYNVAIASTTSWPGLLSVTPSSGGATPSTLQLTISPPGLEGLYQGSIVLSSPTAAFAPVTIPVIVTVNNGPSGSSPLVCTFNNVQIPGLRATGVSEFVGDVVVGCVNGTPTAAGAPVPSYDVQFTLSSIVTSRTYGNGWSEALLTIDEPGSGLVGSPANLLACGDPSGTCALTGTGTGVGTYSGAAGRPNVFPGRVSGNTVTFPGIPIDPAGLGGNRILRITNVRTDTFGVPALPPSVTGTVSLGGVVLATTPVVGNVASSLAISVRTTDDSAFSSGSVINQCPSALPQQAGVLRFSSLAGTTFRPRTLAPYVDSQTSPPPQPQSVPGNPFDLNTESKFYAPSLTSPVVDFTSVGLASAGTRLRAQIANIPAGTRVFVSTLPVVYSGGIPAAATSGSIARLVQNEMLPFLPLASTATLDGIPAAEFTPIQGSASAVWEVLLSNNSSLQNLDFLVWVQPAANSTSPATFTGTFAPAPPAFLDSISHAASPTLPVPRFAASGGGGLNLFSVSGCPAITAAPDLVVTSLTGPASGNPGETVSLSTTVLNQGTAAAGPFRVEFYFSGTTNVALDNAIDTTAGCAVPGLAAGASFICSMSVAVPASLTAGTWYLAALADSGNQVNELDETNNWRIADSGPITMGAPLCYLSLAPPAASLPATGTSTPAVCPNPGQPACGFYPEAPLSLTVTPIGTCGAWTATSSNPAFVQIVYGASGSGAGAVGLTVLTNMHTTSRTATVTVTSGAASSSFPLTQAGSADSLTYREVYALYEQLLGRDPDPAASPSGPGGRRGPGPDGRFLPHQPGGLQQRLRGHGGIPGRHWRATPTLPSSWRGHQLADRRPNRSRIVRFPDRRQLHGDESVPESAGTADRRQVRSPAANNAGLASWFQTLIGYPGSGTPVSTANNEFQSTGSFHADHTNALYVQMLYFMILSRDPDPAGLQLLVGIANSGGPGLLFQGAAGFHTRLQILGLGTPNQGFIGSPEFQGLFAN